MALKLVIDTNRYVDFARGVQEVVELLESADLIYVPFVVLAELRGGFRHGRRPAENETNLQGFLDVEQVEVLWADELTVAIWADLYARLRALGRSIPANDLWIASLCVQRGAPLYTRDQHFQSVPGLARV